MDANAYRAFMAQAQEASRFMEDIRPGVLSRESCRCQESTPGSASAACSGRSPETPHNSELCASADEARRSKVRFAGSLGAPACGRTLEHALLASAGSLARNLPTSATPPHPPELMRDVEQMRRAKDEMEAEISRCKQAIERSERERAAQEEEWWAAEQA